MRKESMYICKQVGNTFQTNDGFAAVQDSSRLAKLYVNYPEQVKTGFVFVDGKQERLLDLQKKGEKNAKKMDRLLSSMLAVDSSEEDEELQDMSMSPTTISRDSKAARVTG